jgi:hypothetical protein
VLDKEKMVRPTWTKPDGLQPFADEEYNKRQAYWLTVCNDFSTCTPILGIQNKSFPKSYCQQTVLTLYISNHLTMI